MLYDSQPSVCFSRAMIAASDTLWLPHHSVSSGCRLYKLPRSASQACCKVNGLTMWTLVVLCSVIASYGVQGIVRYPCFCVLSDFRLSSSWKDRLCVFILFRIEFLSVVSCFLTCLWVASNLTFCLVCFSHNPSGDNWWTTLAQPEETGTKYK